MSRQEIASLIGELTLTRDEAERETKLLKAKIGTYSESFERVGYAVSGISGKGIRGDQKWPTAAEARAIFESAPSIDDVLGLMRRLTEETEKMESADAELAKIRAQ